MTAQSPHPQRCETCDKYSETPHPVYEGNVICFCGEERTQIETKAITLKHGCASHSSIPTTPEGHCGHECVCAVLALGGIVGDTTPCDLTQDCIFDTRKQPSAEQRIEKAIEELEALCNTCTSEDTKCGARYAISLLRGARE